MELHSRKKSRRNRLMRSESFETQEVIEIRPEESRWVERLSHYMDENKRRCLLDGRKGMQTLGKIENVKKKIHARARKVL